MKKYLLLIIATMLLVTGCGEKEKVNKGDEQTKKDESGETVNTSSELNKEKTFDSFKVSSVSLKTENGINTLTATIENISEKNTTEGIYNIIFNDKKGKELGKVSIYLKALSPKESVDIRSTINLNVIESYDFVLKKA